MPLSPPSNLKSGPRRAAGVGAEIIRLVAMRLLSATGEKHIYDETSVTLTCEGYEFKAKGKPVVQDG